MKWLWRGIVEEAKHSYAFGVIAVLAVLLVLAIIMGMWCWDHHLWPEAVPQARKAAT
ncbi:MAG TPA: hypothetical protein VE251_00960 [Xanthobacteraceae bacterium]|jgi:uncharacterized membrane protein YqjE|nr:hypothetical protein [Xanthobacteraceae bacterium]